MLITHFKKKKKVHPENTMDFNFPVCLYNGRRMKEDYTAEAIDFGLIFHLPYE